MTHNILKSIYGNTDVNKSIKLSAAQCPTYLSSSLLFFGDLFINVVSVLIYMINRSGSELFYNE